MSDSGAVRMPLSNGLTSIATYELIERDILVIKNAFDYGPELIAATEALPHLWRAGGVRSPKGQGYDAEARRCRELLVTGEGNSSLERFESAIFGTVGAALQLYVDRNPFILVTDDLGYNLVRYQVGDFFKAHADSAPGETEFSGRRVSVLAYPNEGYEGGELYFLRQNFTFKPTTGSIVLFPSFYTHPHESKPI